MRFKLVMLSSMILLLAIGCASTPQTENFGKVQVIKKTEVIEKETGDISVQLKRLEEIAEKSTADKGSGSLMAPQKFISVGSSFFSHYSVGPDNKVVISLFNQKGDLGSDLWLYQEGKKIRLTNTNYNHEYPSFSSDGQHIYFTSYRGKKILTKYGQDSYVWRTSSSGKGGITRIGAPAYQYMYPEESPGGDNILLAAKELHGNSSFIWYMEKNGALPTQLRQGLYSSWMTSEKILFNCRDENSGLYTIWTCKLDGSEMTQLISDTNHDCIQPAASSDGRYIAYVKENPVNENPEETRDVYIFDTKNGLSQQITTNKSRDDLPKWSPHDHFLYFRSSRGMGWNIWRIATEFLKNQ